MKRATRRGLWFLLLGAAIVSTFAVTTNAHFLTLERVIAFVEMARAHPWLTAGFYLFFVVGVMGLPITLFPIVGGVLLPFWLAFPLNLTAATGGALLSFCAARTFGQRIVEPMLKRRAAIWQKVADARGFQTVLLLRLVGIPPFIVTNYALGLSRVSVVDFLTATLIGILPWMGIVTYLAASLWEAVLVGGREGLGKAMWHALGPLFFVSLAIAAVMLTAHGVKRRRRQAHSNL